MDKLVNEGALSKTGRDSYNINRQKVVIQLPCCLSVRLYDKLVYIVDD